MGKPLEYDALHPLHQVPGGMISNFRFQLGNLGKLDQLPAVLEEVSRVRAEFGYPIMVTPYSQFFGVQAAINVMVGKRYKEVTDEVLLYALGFWGEEEAQSIDADLKDRLLSSPRAKELAKLETAGYVAERNFAKSSAAPASVTMTGCCIISPARTPLPRCAPPALPRIIRPRPPRCWR